MTDWDTQVVVRLALLPALRALWQGMRNAPPTPMYCAIWITWVASVAFVIIASIPKEWM